MRAISGCYGHHESGLHGRHGSLHSGSRQTEETLMGALDMCSHTESDLCGLLPLLLWAVMVGDMV